MLLKLIIAGAIGAVLGGAIGYFGQCRSGACPITSSPWGGGIYGAIVAMLLVGLTAGGVSCQNPPGATSGDDPGGAKTSTEAAEKGAKYVLEISTEPEFDRVLENQDTVLADFYADWCPPCRRLKPRIHEIAGEYAGRLTVIAVNVDDLGKLAKRYQISAIPDVRLFHKGEEVKRWIGIKSKKAYTRKIDDYVQ